MKKIFLFLICAMLLTACAADPVPVETTQPIDNVQIANPWKSYDSLTEAEAVCGLDFPLPGEIVGYTAEAFRVMSGSLLEVTYQDDNFEVIVRMAKEEAADLSGVYQTAEKEQPFQYNDITGTIRTLEGYGVVQLVWYGGFSYSLYAPNGYWGDSNADFMGSLYVGIEAAPEPAG